MTLPSIFRPISRFLFGRPSRTVTRPRYLPAQQAILDQITGQVSNILPSALQQYQNILGNDEATIQNYLQPYRSSFYNYGLPQLMERLGQYQEGAENSSGFQNAIADAVARNEAELLSQRMNLQSGALSSLLPFLQASLGDREYGYTTPRRPGALESFLKTLTSTTSLGRSNINRLGNLFL